MANYLIQVVLFQFFFIIIYDVFLRKETFFNWNRAYLLVTPIMSFTFPFIRINAFEKASQNNFVAYLPAVILNPQESIGKVMPISFTDYMPIILLLGMFIMLGLFLYKLTSLFILRHQSKTEKHASHTLVIIDKPGVIFSFFKEIFIDKSFLNQTHQHIIKHELIHITHYHSVDLLLFEILKIVSWFNPAIYIFQNRITELHEFIADAKTIEPHNKSDFFNSLLTTTFKVTKVDFINQFYKHSLIKKRIMMTNKNKSKQVLKLKYLLLVPVLGSMLFYTSCQEKKQTIEQQVATLKASIKQKDTISKAETKEIISLALSKKLFIKNLLITDSTHVEVEEYPTVPFAIIEQTPIYPGCENAKDQKKCFSSKLTSLITQHFDVKLANNLGLSPGKKRIFVMFTIDETGEVINIKARAPHKRLEEEAKRVIYRFFPKVTPGRDKGKAVAVKYSLPIVINVAE